MWSSVVRLCFQFQEQLGQGCSPEEEDTFQAQGSEILDQMLQCLEHLPKPMPQLEVDEPMCLSEV